MYSGYVLGQHEGSRTPEEGMTIQLPLDQAHPIRPPGNLRDLQAQGPVHRVRTAVGDPAWLVTGYRELQELFLDSRLGQSRPSRAPPRGGAIHCCMAARGETTRLSRRITPGSAPGCSRTSRRGGCAGCGPASKRSPRN